MWPGADRSCRPHRSPHAHRYLLNELLVNTSGQTSILPCGNPCLTYTIDLISGWALSNGDEVSVQLRETNLAGLSGLSPIATVILDATAPDNPATISFCELASGNSGLISGGSPLVYTQPAKYAVSLCWQPPGFTDSESGIRQLEWAMYQGLSGPMVAGWVAVSTEDSRAAISSGIIELDVQAQGAELAHGVLYRVILRSTNGADVSRPVPAAGSHPRAVQ